MKRVYGNKYGAKKTLGYWHGEQVMFDSHAEARRSFELCTLEKSGLISALQRQVPFCIMAKTKRTPKHVYTADFAYIEGDRLIVEDVKGVATTDYKLRRDMLINTHPAYTFREYRNGEYKDY